MAQTRLGIRLWIEGEDGTLVSSGRMRLLALIDQLGSLNKAAKEIGMSYRRAWGRIQETEERLGEPVVVRSRGRKGYELTEFGRQLLASWEEFRSDVSAYAGKRADAMLPWNVKLKQRGGKG
ncbi:MAG: LysR family transcriptional regulator [Proteobacteria bacterium]|nr:LysR family transcriptional regulator [Pseudomonadota bacterium]MBU1611876.1 LysR family transcriptional regulator [Pseudomonadota bacterium]